MSEEQELEQMRENFLGALRAAADFDAAVADFAPIEEAFIRAIRLNTDYQRADVDDAFGIALTVETEERKRQIQNQRSIGNMNRFLGDSEKWR